MTSRGSRLKRFFKRHDRWLTFAGAFIVFMTFIVKEGLGEHWRATAETIDMAQYIFGIRAEVKNIRDDIAGIQFPEQPEKDNVTDYIRQRYENAEHCYSVNVDSFRDIQQKLEIDNILINKLPEQGAARQLKAQVESKLKSFKEQVDALARSVTDATPFYLPKDRLVEEKALKEAEVKCETANKSFMFLSGASLGFEMRVLNEAEITRQRNDKYSQYAWRISTFLFALGWGLGFVGKVYGLPGVGGGE